ARLRLPLHGGSSGREAGGPFGRYLPATGGPGGLHGPPPGPAPFALRRPGGAGVPDDVQGQPGDPVYEEYLAARQEHTRAIEEAASGLEATRKQQEDAIEQARAQYQAAKRE